MKIRRIIAFLLLIFMLPCFVIFTSANSAQMNWNGRDESGVLCVDGESPIVIEHETLTFDLADFPNYTHFDPVNDNYNGKVSAEYTFYNPSDMTITAVLAFPIGDSFQSYAYNYSDYSITVNGEPIRSEIRHTMTHYYDGFNVSVDLPRLRDDYYKDDFFSVDLQATQYQITLSDMNYDTDSNKTQKYGINIDPKKYPNNLFYFPKDASYRILDDGTYRVYGTAWQNGQTITFYAIGESLRSYPETKIYDDQYCFDSNVVQGQGECTYVQDITLGDLIFEKYDESRGISRMDWYNANIDILLKERMSQKPIATISKFDLWHSYKLRTWYCYELTFAPGERLTNTITAPIYPDVTKAVKGEIYTYNYLLSPASTWVEFGGLDIVINTPYYLKSTNIEGFEKTETGYAISLDELPRDSETGFCDLNFSICEEKPVQNVAGKGEDRPTKKFNLPLLIISVSLTVTLFTAIIVYRKKLKLIFILIKRRFSKK